MAAKKYKNKQWLGALILIAVIAIGGAVYIKLSQHPTDTATQTHTSAPKQYSQTQGNGQAGSTSSPGSGGGSAASSSSATLPAPSGQLLNKQTISLSSSDPQTSPDLESVCQTMANAECTVALTGPSGHRLSVGNHPTGSSGTVIIDWNAHTVGITPGKWAVRAVVTQNSQTGSSHTEYLQVNP